MWLENLGFAEPRARAGSMIEDGRHRSSTATSRSTCRAACCRTNPIGASGMLRFAEAAMQVRGQAGEHQVDGARTRRRPRLRRRLAVLRHVGRRRGQAVTRPGAWTGKVAHRHRWRARGQGEAEARLFAAEGAKVVLADVLDDEGAPSPTTIGDAGPLRAPRRHRRGDWQAVVAATEEAFGPVSVAREQRRHPRASTRSIDRTPPSSAG